MRRSKCRQWYANLHPEEDKAAIQILMDCLSTVKAKHFILISTIDVYSSFIPSPDESSIPDETRQDAYGKTATSSNAGWENISPLH